MQDSKDVSVSINQDPQKVYDYASNPKNLPKWAAGLAKSEPVKDGDYWIADSPMGKVKVKFAPKNKEGILDHEVVLPSGETNHNPVRVNKTEKGSEVKFTVIRREGMTADQFNRDVSAVMRDLEILKVNLEAIKR